MLDNIEKVLFEFYGFSLLEFVFYALDAFIALVAFVTLIVVTFRHFRKTGSPHSKLMFLSFLGILLSSIVAAMVENYIDTDHYSLLQLLVIYLPIVFVVSATIGFKRLCSVQQG